VIDERALSDGRHLLRLKGVGVVITGRSQRPGSRG
jgi:hypothetical protein